MICMQVDQKASEVGAPSKGEGLVKPEAGSASTNNSKLTQDTVINVVAVPAKDKVQSTTQPLLGWSMNLL
jgi:hypothetical protein